MTRAAFLFGSTFTFPFGVRKKTHCEPVPELQKGGNAMDATTIIVVVAIFACIVVAAFLVYRSRAKVSIRGPLGTGLEIDASNQLQATPALSRPGVHIDAV